MHPIHWNCFFALQKNELQFTILFIQLTLLDTSVLSLFTMPKQHKHSCQMQSQRSALLTISNLNIMAELTNNRGWEDEMHVDKYFHYKLLLCSAYKLPFSKKNLECADSSSIFFAVFGSLFLFSLISTVCISQNNKVWKELQIKDIISCS